MPAHRAAGEGAGDAEGIFPSRMAEGDLFVRERGRMVEQEGEGGVFLFFRRNGGGVAAGVLREVVFQYGMQAAGVQQVV